MIFYTAAFLEHEARTLAELCGVTHFLMKPCGIEVLVPMVNEALGADAAPPPPPAAAKRDDAVASLIDALHEKGEQLNAVSIQLAMLVQIGLELASEHRPAKLLAKFCHASRDMVGARYAKVGILDQAQPRLSHFYTSGMDETLAARFQPAPFLGQCVAEMLDSQTPLRWRGRENEPQKLNLPDEFPSVNSLLGIPVQTSRCLYGWVCLVDKLGAGYFAEEDEGLTSMLAALAAVSFQNDKLIAEIRPPVFPPEFDQSNDSGLPAASGKKAKEVERCS